MSSAIVPIKTAKNESATPTRHEKTSALVTPSPSSKSRFRRIGLQRTMSKDKASCEYYKEEDYLAEGDLPSLGVPSIPYTRPSAIHSSDRPSAAAIVTPTSRSATPIVKNKSQSSQKIGRKLFQRRKENNVTIEAPMLSPETKRKHKVFWSQMDLNDDNTTIGGNSVSALEEEMPDDERHDLNMGRQRSLPNKVEQVEYDVPVTTHDIITILTDMCADCGWTRTKQGQETGATSDGIQPDYVQETPRNILTNNDVYPVDRTKAILDQDESYSKYDDESLPSKATAESSPGAQSRSPSKTAYYTDAYENTAIEVEYYDAGVPDDEMDDDSPPHEGFLQLDHTGDVSAFVRPQDRAMSEIHGRADDGTFGYPISKSKSMSALDRNAYLQAMAKKAKEDFMQRKTNEGDGSLESSKSLDREEGGTAGRLLKNSRKIPTFESMDASSEHAGSVSIGSNRNRSAMSATSTAHNGKKSNYTSPSGVAEFPLDPHNTSMEIASDIGPRSSIPLGLKKVKSEIAPSSTKSAFIPVRKPLFNKIALDSPRRSYSRSNGGVDGPYEIESKGSILSFGRKKKVKNGEFYKIDDGSDNEEDDSMDLAAPPNHRERANRVRSMPNDEIFDFEDSNPTEITNTKAPLSSIKLDPKEDSCDISLLGSLAGNGDGGTVFSSRSMYTIGTNATNWSTSTRRRHRGAARQRLSEVKDEDQRPSGWLDSIKAAAEKNNCRWDPKLGWVDYVEPKNEETEEPKVSNQRIGRLKTPKFKGTGKNKRKDDDSSCADSQSISSQLPFPSKWERAREEMLRTNDGAASVVTEVASNKMLKPLKTAQQSQSGDVDIQFELGAAETIVEEENLDSDNKSDSLSDTEKPSVGNSSNGKESPEIQEEELEIPEKGKLFEWVGKINNESTSNSKEFRDEAKETTLKSTMDQRMEVIPTPKDMTDKALEASPSNPKDSKTRQLTSSSSFPDISENKNSSQESDADDFGQLFDFSITDSAKDIDEEGPENLEDDGFMVIKDSKGMGFERKRRNSFKISQDLKEVGDQVSNLMGKYTLKDDAAAASAGRSVMSTNSVSSKAKDWMERIEKNKGQVVKPNENIERSKSALFVSAVDDDSTFEYQPNKVVSGDDTIFDFDGPSKTKPYNRKADGIAAPQFVKPRSTYSTQNESASGLTSSSDVPENDQNEPSRYKAFLSRLQACTAPVVEDDVSLKSMPQAHLAFMRNSAASQDNRFMTLIKNQTLCGSTNNIDDSTKTGLPPRTPSSLISGTKGRSTLASNYLQAIKDKSNGEKNSEQRDSGDIRRVNSISSTSSSTSDAWQKFLEKRNKALASSTSRNSDHSSTSKVAGEYARSKVQEVIQRISNDKSGEQDNAYRRAQSAGRMRPPSSSSVSGPRSLSAGRTRQPSNSAMPGVTRENASKAVEDLAAAKVEAMMTMMSNSSFEGEI